MQWVSERASQHRQPAAVSSPSFVRSFVVRRLFVRSLTSFVRLLRSFVRRSFIVVRLFFRSFFSSKVRSLVRSFLCSYTRFKVR